MSYINDKQLAAIARHCAPVIEAISRAMLYIRSDANLIWDLRLSSEETIEYEPTETGNSFNKVAYEIKIRIEPK